LNKSSAKGVAKGVGRRGEGREITLGIPPFTSFFAHFFKTWQKSDKEELLI
jgi:hypothetical protein